MLMGKIITGTFLDGLAADIPSNNWCREDWRRQFDNMKSLGMDTVIIIRVGFGESAMYNSKVMPTVLHPEEDMVEVMFDEADRTDLKVYLGLYDSVKYWVKNDWKTEVDINIELIDEMWERYKGHKSFHGWYMSHEGGVENMMPMIWKPLGQKVKKLDIAKKVLVSPRYAGEKWCGPISFITPELHYRHFDYVFGEMEGLIDEAAFMDGHTLFKSLKGFVEATSEICKKYNIAFWSNLETFDRDVAWCFPPIEWTKMKFKLEVVQPYVEKIITFEAPHFLSPYSTYPAAGNLYDRYVEYIKAAGYEFEPVLARTGAKNR